MSSNLKLSERTEAEYRAWQVWSREKHGPDCIPPDKFRRGGKCVCDYAERLNAAMSSPTQDEMPRGKILG